MKTSLILLVLSVLASFAIGQFPPFVKLCKRDGNINECVKENILVAKKYAKKGIPKLFVLPLQPFQMVKASVETPTLKIEATKVVAYGIDQFELKDLNIDLENNIFQIEINVKNLEATALYKFDGKLIGIPLKSEGIVNGNMTDFGLDVSLRGKRFERNGKTYIDFDDRKVKLVFEKANAHFGNLFPNSELTEVTNRIINDNIKEVVYELQPIFEDVYAFIISDSITKLFQKYSIDELFPL